MKQSIKSRLPKLNEAVPYSDFVNEPFINIDKFIAHVDPTNPLSLYQAVKKERKYCILIGPEGDFTNDELTLASDKRFTKVNLGNSRLRTETAGIVACNTLNLINSK
jgi:16S rRNA (uracil1498-N3)-methyltransferase